MIILSILILIFAFFCPIFGQENYCDCGIEQLTKKPVNGALDKYPWIVDLELSYKQKGASFFSKTEKTKCSGVIVDSTTIYSLSSCFLGDMAYAYEKISLKVNMIIDSKIKSINLSPVKLRKDRTTSATTIILPKPLQFSKSFMPICTEGDAKLADDTKLRIIGKGILEYKEKPINSNYPMEVDVTSKGELLDNQSEFNYCPSDRGGPVMYRKSEKWYLKGNLNLLLDDCKSANKMARNGNIVLIAGDLKHKINNGCQ